MRFLIGWRPSRGRGRPHPQWALWVFRGRCRQRRPSGRLRLAASLSSVGRSARSEVETGRAMTALIGRAAACFGAGTRDPERLGSASATPTVVRIALMAELPRGRTTAEMARPPVARWALWRGTRRSEILCSSKHPSLRFRNGPLHRIGIGIGSGIGSDADKGSRVGLAPPMR